MPLFKELFRRIDRKVFRDTETRGLKSPAPGLPMLRDGEDLKRNLRRVRRNMVDVFGRKR